MTADSCEILYNLLIEAKNRNITEYVVTKLTVDAESLAEESLARILEALAEQKEGELRSIVLMNC